MVCRVEKPHTWLGVAASFLICASAAAQEQVSPQQRFQVATLSRAASELSSDCSVKKAYGPRVPLYSVRRALREQRPVKVLAIGSSSTVGVGASSPAAAYPARLEVTLEGFLPGVDIRVMNRGVSGETGRGAVERLKLEVAETMPDLVVWQVGTNDALARIDEDDFAETLREAIDWLEANRIDIVLIDPQYVERLAGDGYYTRIVKTIADVAGKERVLLVNRFEAMADLAKRKGNSAFLAQDRFHLNDVGYRCMAEYAARAIAAGILQAEAEAARQN